MRLSVRMLKFSIHRRWVSEEPRRFDISAIDFDLLRREFAKVKKKNLVLKDLEELIQMKLDRMLFANPERINYYERYQQIYEYVYTRYKKDA